jgi:hypothetical protein
VTQPEVTSPLLNFPALRLKVTVVPAGCGDAGVNNNCGSPSTVKATEAESPPGLAVTVRVSTVLTISDKPTEKVPVTFPELTLQDGTGLAAIVFTSGSAVIWQVVSEELNPLP